MSENRKSNYFEFLFKKIFAKTSCQGFCNRVVLESQNALINRWGQQWGTVKQFMTDCAPANLGSIPPWILQRFLVKPPKASLVNFGLSIFAMFNLSLCALENQIFCDWDRTRGSFDGDCLWIGRLDHSASHFLSFCLFNWSNKLSTTAQVKQIWSYVTLYYAAESKGTITSACQRSRTRMAIIHNGGLN